MTIANLITNSTKTLIKNLDIAMSTGVVGYTAATTNDPSTLATAVIDGTENVVANRLANVATDVGNAALKGDSTAAQEIAKEAASKLLVKMGVKSATTSSSLTTEAAAESALGPVGIALMIIQIAGAAIDMLWNPFQTYTNSELADMKTLMDNNISEYFKKIGYAYPTETKPNIIPQTDEEIAQFNKDRSTYYTDNNLVSKDDVISEEEMINRINSNTRFDNIFYLDPSTNTYSTRSASIASQSKILDTSNAMSLLLLATIKAKGLNVSGITGRKVKSVTTPQLANNNVYIKFIITNFIPILILFGILLSLLSSIILVLFI